MRGRCAGLVSLLRASRFRHRYRLPIGRRFPESSVKSRICPYMRIDAHQHFWRYNPARDGWITDEMAVLKNDFLPVHLVPELVANTIQASIPMLATQSRAKT